MAAGNRLEELEARDIASLSAAEAASALRDVAVIRGTTDQLEAAIARRIGEFHRAGVASTAADALGRHGHTSRRVAERAERRADRTQPLRFR